MKKKKILAIFALALSITTLSSCTNTDQTITFSSYWNENSLAVTSIHETLEYDVGFEKGSGFSAVNYNLDYNGKYTTELKSETENGRSIYVYKTKLDVTATYTYKGETAALNDSVISETRFLTVENSLRPLSSTKTIISNSPTMGGANTLGECYNTFHYSISTVYNEDGSEGACTVVSNPGTDKEQPQDPMSFAIEDKYTYLDNEQLLFALRGIPASKTSASVYAYSPFVDKVQTVNITFSSEETTEFSFYKNGSAEKQTSAIAYRPVSIVLNEQYPGGTQTAWIAKATNPDANTNRNVMLQLECPISYSLGKLVYKLSSVSYQ